MLKESEWSSNYVRKNLRKKTKVVIDSYISDLRKFIIKLVKREPKTFKV